MPTCGIFQPGKGRQSYRSHDSLRLDVPLLQILSRSGAILITCHYRLIEIDDFMANLWKVHLEVKQEGYAHVRIT